MALISFSFSLGFFSYCPKADQELSITEIDENGIWLCTYCNIMASHDDVIKWKHFPRNWLFVRGIHRSRWIPPHKGQWRGALMFSLICVWLNVWVNNHEAGDFRRHRGHCDVSVMRRNQIIMSTQSSHLCLQPNSGPRLNIKTVLSTYGDFHVKDKTAVRTSYL